MPVYDIRPLQLRILEILVSFDKICKEHHLRYYMMAGTMLGAVRHGGFIPWDDDIDVGMPRADYEIFRTNAKQWLPRQYEFVCPENNKRYPFAFAKIQDAGTTFIEQRGFRHIGGIYMDVFPLDGVPQGKWRKKIHFLKYRWLVKALYFTCRDPYRHGRGAGSFIPLLCRKLLTPDGIQRQIRKILTQYDFDNSTLVADYDDKAKGIMDKTVLGNPTPLLFEGKELWGVEKQDFYLKQKYGDYMQIPAKENQRQHKYDYLSLDKPYKEYAG
jgi:lipopolysaccharide cholinephosphotransferase